MSDSSTSVTIVLGTTSALKLQAIKGAFASAATQIGHELGVASPAFVFVTTNTKSGVNEQPFGWEETIKGANNRTKHAIELAGTEQKPRFVVAIENGVVDLPANGANYYMDIGWAILTDMSTGLQYVSSSTSLSVPSELVEAAKAKGFDKCTIGDVLHERNPTISTKDPHFSLLGGLMSRTPLMEQAVSSCIGQWLFAASSSSH